LTTKFAVLVVLLGLVAAPLAATAEDIPDALAVEWQGKKLCENLYEDTQIRVLRCTFPPGAVHVKHSHRPSFGYVLSGGQVQVTVSCSPFWRGLS
jgi:beta-alanine degradation protein BauB